MARRDRSTVGAPRRERPTTGTAKRERATEEEAPGLEELEFEERVVSINRVAKVQQGGRRFGFTAMVVVGDRKGHVGAGLGKAREVPDAIRKGVEAARKNMISVPMLGHTIPHTVVTEYGAAKVLLKPASPGTGVIAGGGVRAVVEAAGIRDILTKSLGSANAINVVRATMKALGQLKNLEEEARRRNKPLAQVTPGWARKKVSENERT